MDLKTTYLGFELKHPIILGASPLVDDLDKVKRAEDAGVSAIVMHSLFEEQIRLEQATQDQLAGSGTSAEASGFLPNLNTFVLGPEAYLDQIRKVKAAVSCPVIGSLNGSTNSGWLEYAKLIEGAGADALELNVYSVASDPKLTGTQVEAQVVDMVKAVTKATKLPVSIKLSPFYSSLPNFVKSLEDAGAKGVVLFNRFYQTDLDIENLDVSLKLQLSTSRELLLRLRWLALLSGRVNVSLGLTGGVHSAEDALKAVMAGAHGVQVVSTVIEKGPGVLKTLRDGMEEWLEKHDYKSLRQAQGSLSLQKSPSPETFERGNYVKILQGYAKSML